MSFSVGRLIQPFIQIQWHNVNLTAFEAEASESLVVEPSSEPADSLPLFE